MVDEGEPRSPVKDAGWLILFLIVLGVIWFAQGGPTRLANITSPFISAPHPNQPSSSGKTAPPVENTSLQNILMKLQNSPYKEKVSLNTGGVSQTDPQKEYLEIRAGYDNTESIPITGWTLEGKNGIYISIASGAYLPYSAQVNVQSSIFLEKNGNAIITTGQSPIGTNFRLNICTGYFNQFQNFYPSLPQQCPRLSEDEIPINYPDACFDFIKSLTTCRMPITAVPAAAGNSCTEFVNEKANYNGCIEMHKNDMDFYKPDWRIYLSRNEELWGNEHDNIILLDQDGKLVDYVSY